MESSFTKFGVNKEFWNTIVRPALFKLRGERCEICAETENLHIHHEDYDEQTIHTLKVVCRKCHIGIHKEGSK